MNSTCNIVHKQDDKLFLKIYSDVVERRKNQNLSREYVYHYVLNAHNYGKKRVDEYTRNNIIKRLWRLEEKASDPVSVQSATQCEELLREVRDIGKVIFSMVLSEDVRDALFEANQFGKHLIIENSDSLIPLELAFNGKHFLSLVYSFGRSVPTYHSASIPRSTPNLQFYILADPTCDLPDAKKEGDYLEEMVSNFKDDGSTLIDVKKYTGQAVTKELVLFDLLLDGKCDVLHYCGHCEFDNEIPSESGLVLNDGYLKAHEVEEMKGHPIVFNNGCSTASEGEQKALYGRGFVEGLASSFVKYGASAYIGCLWPVKDDAATEVSKMFYTHLVQEGLPLGESLRRAKDKLFQQGPSSALACLSYISFGDPSFRLFEENNEYLYRTTYSNEQAVYQVMKFEKQYSKLEMLTINDHHWIFWTKRQILKWVEKITHSEKEREALLVAFDDYQQHFRKLAQNEQKYFKIILNLKSFKDYIENLGKEEAVEILIDTMKFLELPNFYLIFYDGHEQLIEEYEIVSKHQNELTCISDNICVVIKESRIDKDSLYYFLYFNDSEELILDHINRYNDYKRLCLDKYSRDFSEILSPENNEGEGLCTDLMVKRVTKYILEELIKSKQ